MSLAKALNLLLKGKKTSVGVITKIAPTLGKSRTAEYLMKTGYKRGASKGYAEVMAKLKSKKE